jgi:hypothetical protein
MEREVYAEREEEGLRVGTPGGRREVIGCSSEVEVRSSMAMRFRSFWTQLRDGQRRRRRRGGGEGILVESEFDPTVSFNLGDVRPETLSGGEDDLAKILSGRVLEISDGGGGKGRRQTLRLM